MLISCSEHESLIKYNNELDFVDNIKRFPSKKALQEQIECFSNNNENIKSEQDEESYSICGLDTLVPNEAFRNCLNSQGEIIVGDSIYKINANGTFFSHVNYIEELREVSKNANIKDLFENNKPLIKIGNVYVFNTFRNDKSETLLHEATGVKSDVDINQFPIKNMDNKTIVGKFLGNFFGSNKDGRVYINSESRVNASLYSYNYVIYSEAGLSVKIQKKMWYGGWGKYRNWSAGTTIGWNGVIIRIPIQFPLDYSQFIPNEPSDLYREYVRLNDDYVDFKKFPFNIGDEKVLICIPYLFKKEFSYANIQKEIYSFFVRTVKSEIDRLAERDNYKKGEYDYGMLIYTKKEVFVYIQNSSRWKSGPSQTKVFDKDWHFLLKYSSGDNFWKFVQNSVVAAFNLGHNELVCGEAYVYTQKNGKYYGMRLYKKTL